MVKILYIYRSFTFWGGIERVLIDKMNYLSNHGFEVYMLITCQGTHPVPFHLDKKYKWEIWEFNSINSIDTMG